MKYNIIVFLQKCTEEFEGGLAMSSRVFQSVLIQMKEATDRVIGVIDAEGNVVEKYDFTIIVSTIDCPDEPIDIHEGFTIDGSNRCTSCNE